MNKREKLLAGAILLLIAAWGAKSLYGRYQTALDDRRTKLQDATTRLSDVNLAAAQGRSAVEQMEAWQQRSLPANSEKARSLYKAWLLAKAKEAGLTVSDIKLAPRTSSSKAYDAIGYQVEASGSLSAVAAMLYEFYRSPQLQQITRLRLVRPPGAPHLQVSLDVEALSLPGAIATDRLPEGDSKRLKLASLAEYQKTLGERDLVTVYTAPQPPQPAGERRDPPAPPKFDDAEQARFSATVSSGKGLQAWINVRTTGETLHLAAGDPVKVGALEGEIVSVEPRSLVLKIGDKMFRVALGEFLRKGTPLEDEAQPATGTTAPVAVPNS